MGFLQRLFGLGKPCPACGDPGATRNAAGQWICGNPQCRNYRRDRVARKDPAAATPPAAGQAAAGADQLPLHYTNFRGQAKVFAAERGFVVDRGEFVLVRVAPARRQIALRKSRLAPDDLAVLLAAGAVAAAEPFAEPVEVHYTNFQGQAKVFVADRQSVRDAGTFVSVVVEPRHPRIALRKTKIAPADLRQLLGH